ncbi:MAG: hypothetical protein ACOX6E_04610 [Syntrophomonadaceae bacterium]|jgi:TRAP-type C4-dicarboxylate transport system substrate-binding protein
MRRYLWTIFLVFTIFITGCSTEKGDTQDEQNAGNQTDVINIIASGNMPPKQGYMVGYHFPWMDRVEEETNGRVKFERYTSAELVPSGGEITALETGTIDLALSGLRSYHPDLFPMADIGSLPVIGTDAVMMTKAYIDLLESDVVLKDGKTYYQLEIEDKGFVAMPMPALTPYQISTSKKQLINPEDFKGVLLRAGSRANELFVINIGGTPVTMVAPELYDAMSRGTIDGTAFSIADWQGYGFQDILRYTILGVDLGTYVGDNLVLKETWESWPQDIRDIMMAIAKDQAIKGAEYWNSLIEPTIKLAEDKGAVFKDYKDLSAETQQLLANAITKTWYDWIDKVTADGAPGLECARLWRDLLIKHGAQVPDEIMDL